MLVVLLPSLIAATAGGPIPSSSGNCAAYVWNQKAAKSMVTNVQRRITAMFLGSMWEAGQLLAQIGSIARIVNVPLESLDTTRGINVDVTGFNNCPLYDRNHENLRDGPTCSLPYRIMHV